MDFPEIYNATQLSALIQEIGIMPLLDSGIEGFSAEMIVSEDCRYTTFPEGGWDWPLWKWKGDIVAEGNCMYGKFFNKKAGFISRELWPDLVNYRRSINPYPTENSIEEAILDTLNYRGSMITRHLRKACGFDGPKMRSKFDAYLTRLEMATYIVTENFIYPTDKKGNPYGWGWSLLTRPEQLYGREACQCEHTPQQSYEILMQRLSKALPKASAKQLERILK